MTKANSSSVTIRDVARLAGVSVATVSRYINQTSPVSSEVAGRLQTAMISLNFVPHAAARKLATQKNYTLGLIITNIASDFFTPLLSGIEDVIGECGYDLLISTSKRAEQRKNLPMPLGKHNTDGVLVFSDSLDNQGLLHYYQINHPVVLIHRTAPPSTSIPCVTVENQAATYKAIEHLIQVHQRRRIVFLAGLQRQEDSFWREMGYRSALHQNGISVDPRLIIAGDFDRQVAEASIRTLLATGIAFDAVFSGDDEAAIGVYTALRNAGKRIPEDVAIIGFDDQRFSTSLTPALTTIHAPTERVGAEATRQLISLIRDGQAEELTLLPTEMIIRQSCGCQG